MTTPRRLLLLLALLVWGAALLISLVLVPALAIAPSMLHFGDTHRDPPDAKAIIGALVTFLVSIYALVSIRRAARGESRATVIVLVLTLGFVAAAVVIALT